MTRREKVERMVSAVLEVLDAMVELRIDVEPAGDPLKSVPPEVVPGKPALDLTAAEVEALEKTFGPMASFCPHCKNAGGVPVCQHCQRPPK